MAQGERSATDSALRRQLLEMLKKEFEELHVGPTTDKDSTPEEGAKTTSTEAAVAASNVDDELERFYRSIHALREKRAALCLSGGGIRSASFALGVLQGLARYDLLGRFHYLSTVSGGGYIGSFLSAWRCHRQNDRAIFDQLKQRRSGYPIAPSDDLFAEPRELQGVRANSNFLTPRLGVLSGDTLAVLALYLRNLWLNWIVFLPLFFAGILIPHVCYNFLASAREDGSPLFRGVFLGAGVLFVAVALCIVAASRPARDVTAAGNFIRRKFRLDNPLWLIVLTFLGGSFFALWRAHTPADANQMSAERLGWAAVAGAVIYLVAWVIGFAIGAKDRALGPPWHLPKNPVPPLQELLCWTAAGAFAGFVIALGGELYGAMSRVTGVSQEGALYWLIIGDKLLFMLVAAGVAWVMLAVLTADLIFTGMTSYMKDGDADREWSGRAAGYLAGAAVGWLVFAGIVLYGPSFFDENLKKVVAAGGLSGIVTLLLGSSSNTGATAARQAFSKLSLNQIVAAATVFFTIILGIVLSKLARWGLVWLEGEFAIEKLGGKALFSLASGVSCVLAALALSYFINVNRFSLHAVYRNRLIRAFLGSARVNAVPRPDPDPLSGFDRSDNLRLAQLWNPGGAVERRLFHVVNTSLNIVDGENLAWQERMAESFAMTPLVCGNPIVGFAPSRNYGDADGISLGTAMAISGAAASPNQGYHSSRLVGFLMMLFNVRLGWWLGNPRFQPIWDREGPRVSFWPIINELLGRTRDDRSYVYLSDGGHFENLGVYEMIRRRCHYIVVSDAGCDPDCAFEDLGNAVRKVWVDFGVKIEFKELRIAARKNPPSGEGVYCAVGHIYYPEAPAEPGYLIYFKPGFYGDEPPDIRAYAAMHPTFPHETTANQWFTESQMESYRSLGAHVIDRLCAGGIARAQSGEPLRGLDEFVHRVGDYLRPRLQPSGEPPTHTNFA
jgi:patatin-like phospholipase